MRLAQAIRTIFAAFRRGEAGVAAVEFALILPIMLLIYIGCAEASTLISMDRKVQNIANSVGDLVSRSDTEITEANLNDYVRVAGGMMSPLSAQGLVQIITQVQVKSDGTGATVIWSNGYRNQAPVTALAKKAGDPYTLPPEVRAVAKGQYVIVAEAVTSYTPLFGIVFDQAIPLDRESFYMPRFGGSITRKP